MLVILSARQNLRHFGTVTPGITRTLILDTIMKLSGTIGVTQKTMTLDTHVRLILLQTLNPQERWGTHKKRWPFQPRPFADVIGLVRSHRDVIWNYASKQLKSDSSIFISGNPFCFVDWGLQFAQMAPSMSLGLKRLLDSRRSSRQPLPALNLTQGGRMRKVGKALKQTQFLKCSWF